MPKTKRITAVKRVSKRPPIFNFKILFLCVLAATALVGFFVYKSLVQKSDINMIVDSGAYPRPYPTATPRPLCATVSTFALANNCGPDSFRSMVFSCAQARKNQRFVTQGNGKTCKTLATWYSEAESSCAANCPSPTPTPTPKTTPQASVMCGQEYGNCIGKTKTCISYSDSCQKTLNCAVPFQACGGSTPTPTPTPIGKETPQASAYPSTTPSYTAVPYPTSITY
jgi:hypothetical protein